MGAGRKLVAIPVSRVEVRISPGWVRVMDGRTLAFIPCGVLRTLAGGMIALMHCGASARSQHVAMLVGRAAAGCLARRVLGTVTC